MGSLCSESKLKTAALEAYPTVIFHTGIGPCSHSQLFNLTQTAATASL